MAATLKKVRPGDPLVIPAATFNAFIDATQDFQERQRRTEQDRYRELRQSGIVLIRNESGADRERFDVLGVAGTIVKPSDNADAFKERVALKGATPGTEHAGRFAVLLEPLVANEVGRACVAGVCVVKVKMNDEGHTFAEAKSGQATMLDSAASGTACLLWVQPPGERDDPQVAWTVARLGGGGSGATTAAFAMVTSKSGSAPPYRYAAVQATMDEDGAWTQVGGGTAYNNVFNLEEQGAGGQWVNPLVTGDVVLIFAAPDPGVDAFVCTRSHYRGTY